MIGLSDKAAKANPTLAAWLEGAGLRVRRFAAGDGWATGPAILSPRRSQGRPALRPGHRPGRPALAHPRHRERARIPALRRRRPRLRQCARRRAGPARRPARLRRAGQRRDARFRAADRGQRLLRAAARRDRHRQGRPRPLHPRLARPRADGPFTAVNCAALARDDARGDPVRPSQGRLHRRAAATARACSAPPTAAPCCSTRSPKSRSRCRPSCSAPCRSARSFPSARSGRSRSTCASSPAPIATSPPKSPPAASAPTSTGGSTCCRSTSPPLRERRLDIRAIAAALLVRHSPAGAPVPFPTAAALDRLAAHAWPGNCRELENVIQRALLLRAGERIEADDLAIDPVAAPGPCRRSRHPRRCGPLRRGEPDPRRARRERRPPPPRRPAARHFRTHASLPARRNARRGGLKEA